MDDEIDLAELFSALLSNWLLIGIVTLMCGIGAVYYAVAVAKPTYEAQAKLAFNSSASGGLSLPGELGALAALVGTSAGGRDGPAATFEDRIKSRDFILEIAREASLFADPVFNPPFGQPGLVRSLLLASGIPNATNYSEAARVARLVSRFNEATSVDLENNGIVVVTVTHPDPDRAAVITNAIINQSLDDLLASERKKSKAQIDYLANELLEAQSQVEATANAITDYAVLNDLASDREVALASSQLVLLREQRDTIQKSLLAIAAMSGNPENQEDWTGASLAELVSEHAVMRENEFRILFGWSSNPQEWTQPSDEQISFVRARLDARREDIARTIDEFEGLARSNAAAATDLARLEREATVQTTVYKVLLQQFETQRISDGFAASIADIYEMAVPPVTPSSPNKRLIVALGLVLGLFVACVLALVLSMRRGTIHTRRAIAAAIQQDVAAGGISWYLGRLRRSADSYLHLFQRRPNDQLEDLGVLIAQDSPKRVLILPTASERIASAIALYMASVDAQISCAVVDLTGTMDVKGHSATGHASGFDEFHLDGGLTVFQPRKANGKSPSVIAQMITNLEGAYDRISVVCPRVESGGAIVSALMPNVQTVITVARAGHTRRAQVDRVKALLKRYAGVHGVLVVE